MRTPPLSSLPSHAAPTGAAPAPCHGPSALRLAPPPPELGPVRDLTGLAGEARERTHRMNAQMREADTRAYAQYLEAYLEGARRCRTVDELRRYGRPGGVAEELPSGARAAELRELERPHQARLHELLATNKELADLVLRLERRPVPLDVFFDVSLGAKLELGGRSYGGTISARDGAAPQVRAAGLALQPGKLEVSGDAGVAGAAATFAADGLESVEVSARALPGVRAFAKQSRGAIEQGIAVGGKLGGKGGAPAVEVEARASVGVTLMTPDVVARALSPRSWWDEK